ncbi:MAG: matrixin family metalloprotease [Pleurocapsa sp.]
MTFNIEFDYRFDTEGFFTEEKKEVLEAAASLWSSYIRDEFPDVSLDIVKVPIASISETSDTEFTISSELQTVTLDEPIDDILIFVYSLDFPENSTTLANGGVFGSWTVGSELDERFNGDDFQPWLGTIYFDTDANFYFDSTTLSDDLPSDQKDFFSVALHEIGHVLGFGSGPIFTELIKDGNFVGENSIALNDGNPIPLAKDLGHIEEGFKLNDQTNVFNPTLAAGERVLPSELDLAFLADIGYEIGSRTYELPKVIDNPTEYMRFIRDFDGNDLGAYDNWKNLGSIDVQGDGDLEYVFVNPTIGRWATVGDIGGRVDFSLHGQGGDTRIVGIYRDPLIDAGIVEAGSPFDSQRRFQNDLYIDNLILIPDSARDYDGDGLSEMYFELVDGTAVLHAYMHADGNIQYANYQSAEDLETYMTANDIDSSVWSDWI